MSTAEIITIDDQVTTMVTPEQQEVVAKWWGAIEATGWAIAVRYDARPTQEVKPDHIV
jgi:hypothetical protein